LADPYKTPDAYVDTGGPQSKLKWKILFWVILTLEVISFFSMYFYPDDEGILYHILELWIYTTILTGIFGYAYNRKILNPTFWRRFIPVGICWDIYTLYRAFISQEQEIAPEYLVIWIGALLAIFLPIVFLQYYAIYKYSFKSDDIWQKNTDK